MSKEAAFNLLTGTESAPSATLEPTPAQADAGLQSSRFAIFAKKEAQLLKDREALKREREELLKEKAEADMYRNKGREFDEIAKKDKIAALKMIGWSDADIINALADGEKKEETPEEIARRIAQEEATKVKQELADAEAARQAKANEESIAQLKSSIKDTIKKQVEKYEFCAFEGADAEAQAYEIIVENLKENGELLSVDEALEIAEEYYEERDRAMNQLKKRQPKTDSPPAAETQASDHVKGEPLKSNVPQRPKTLTNQVSATATAGIPRRETSAEKKARLIKALENGGL